MEIKLPIRLIGEVFRFGTVGVVATLTHALVLWTLVEVAGLIATAGTVLAFFVAFSISYLGHYYFTYRSSVPHIKAMPTFALAACTGASLNAIIFSVMTEVFQYNYWFAFLLVLLSAPPLVYLMTRSLAGVAQPVRTSLDWRVMLVPAVCFSATIVFTLIFYYRAPYFDHWDIVPLFAASQDGTLKPSDLFRQHGSHWHASGYVIMLGTARISGMQHWVDPTISLIIAGLGFLALANIVRSSAEEFGEVKRLPAALALAGFMYFSLDQASNWLWGWQVALFASTTGTLWAIDLLSRSRLTIPRAVLASLASVLAVYGFATAWTLLPIGLALILVSPKASRVVRILSVVIWISTFTALAIHFRITATDYTGTMLPDRTMWEIAFGMTHYVANFFGSAFVVVFKDAAPLISLVGAFSAMFVAIIIARQPSAADLLAARGIIALAAFSVGAALMTALGRWDAFGPEQAFSNRYVTFANYVWLSIALLALFVFNRMPVSARRTAIFLLIGFLGLKMINNASVIRHAQLSQQITQSAALIVCGYPEVSQASADQLSFRSQKIENLLPILEQHHVSLFRDPERYNCGE